MLKAPYQNLIGGFLTSTNFLAGSLAGNQLILTQINLPITRKSLLNQRKNLISILCFIPTLLPLNSCWWFARNIIDDTVDVVHLINDTF